ncbi:MAG: ABC transporter ATP-binding protein [Desulfurococcaceae archaeon]
MVLLKVENLSACIDDKKILEDINLVVNSGEVHIIMGPNGSGKSTLLSTIMGIGNAKVCGGRILFEDKDVTGLPSHERAKLGIALGHQNPPEIKGVKLRDIASAILRKYRCSDCSMMASMLMIDTLLNRDLFVGFSGGERKRTELYLVMIQNPKLAMLDEPDSGVDIESIEIIARSIEALKRKGTSVILVTHVGMITEKISRIDRVHLLISGKMVYSGYPDEVLPVILKFGYKKGVEILLKR